MSIQIAQDTRVGSKKILKRKTSVAIDIVPEKVRGPKPVQQLNRHGNGDFYSRRHILTPEKDGEKTIQGVSLRELSNMIHVGIATEQFLVITEVLKGGADRKEVAERLEKILPRKTKHGTKKPVTNMISGAVALLSAHGFAVKGSWQMVFPLEGD